MEDITSLIREDNPPMWEEDDYPEMWKEENYPAMWKKEAPCKFNETNEIYDTNKSDYMLCRNPMMKGGIWVKEMST